MLTRAMTAEWAEHGIQANAIGPGYMLTDMNQALVDNPDLRRLGQGPHPVAALGQARRTDRRGRVPRLGGVRLRQRPDHLCRRRHARGAVTCGQSERKSTRRKVHAAVVIHAPKDLRIEDSLPEPGPVPAKCGEDRRWRHLRLGPALLPSWRLRHRSPAGADGAWARNRRTVAAVGEGVSRLTLG